MSVLPAVLYGFSVISIKIPMMPLANLEKPILKFIIYVTRVFLSQGENGFLPFYNGKPILFTKATDR